MCGCIVIGTESCKYYRYPLQRSICCYAVGLLHAVFIMKKLAVNNSDVFIFSCGQHLASIVLKLCFTSDSSLDDNTTATRDLVICHTCYEPSAVSINCNIMPQLLYYAKFIKQPVIFCLGFFLHAQ